ncbi:hypothetical protein HZC27_05510 [Candidatus Roizmanbacteria bacterium]|nr:hypothetical protein [Candidatus Roizmanbacteria bacterium]
MIPQLVVLSSKVKQDKYLTDLVASLSLTTYDIFKIEPESDKTGLGIDQIRTLSEVILTQTTTQRVVVLYSFETASLETQNALLKILEEKTLHNAFILFTNNIERIIPTIRSRVQVVILDEKKKILDKDIFPSFENLFELLHDPKSNSFLQLSNLSIKTREDVLQFIDNFILFLKDHLKGKNAGKITAIIKKALQTKNNILSLNTNHQLSLDNLLIFAHKTVSIK